MKNRGFTLLELVVSMILLMIVSSAIATLFTVERTQTMLTQRRVALSEEALVAMNHMEWTLRFAIPGTVITTVPNQVAATIAGGHIDSIPDTDGDPDTDTAVQYNRNANNTLTYTTGGRTVNIADNITSLTVNQNVTQDGVEISIALTAAREGSTISLETTVRALGIGIGA